MLYFHFRLTKKKHPAIFWGQKLWLEPPSQAFLHSFALRRPAYEKCPQSYWSELFPKEQEDSMSRHCSKQPGSPSLSSGFLWEKLKFQRDHRMWEYSERSRNPRRNIGRIDRMCFIFCEKVLEFANIAEAPSLRHSFIYTWVCVLIACNVSALL